MLLLAIFLEYVSEHFGSIEGKCYALGVAAGLDFPEVSAAGLYNTQRHKTPHLVSLQEMPIVTPALQKLVLLFCFMTFHLFMLS